MHKKDLEILDKYLFNPRSVAVIGASNTPGTWGSNTMKGLLDAGKRDIYPVNPNASEIHGLKAYQSITDIPGPVELAVIVVSDKLVPPVLRECVSKGVGAAVIITSGFSETGEEGQKIESELVRIAREGNIRFIGPNSMGHTDTYAQLSTFGQGGKLPTGPVAVLSQSGSTCMKIVRNLAESGIHCSKYISTGNEADLHMEDCLEYLVGDKNTRVIAAYIEGLRDGRRFVNLAQKITAKKPVVVVKVGGTEESARAVMSHTGALAGSDAIYTAAFRQSGVIRADDDDELCDIIYALLNCPLPRGNRVGILSLGGGPGALTAESCEKEGLTIGTLEPSTIKKLDNYLPARWPRRNPVDMAGPSVSQFSVAAELLWPLMEDDNIDTVFLLAPVIIDKTLLASRMSMDDKQIAAYQEKDKKNLKLIRQKMESLGKPVVLMWQWRGMAKDSQMTSIFNREGMLVYSNARRAARVVGLLAWYSRYRQRA